MSNCEKKIDALIDALGFDCDVEFDQQKYDANMDGLGRVGTDYELIVRRSCQGFKLTKRKTNDSNRAARSQSADEKLNEAVARMGQQ